jgi:6-pyruvoyltetrahydropterin/6-carboxytetrahydropterin synthase
VADVTRRYTFTAVQDGHQGRDWDCFVTVHGPIDSVTGMVTDIGALNRLVQDKVIKIFHRKDLREQLGTPTVRGEQLVEKIWRLLQPGVATGRLSNIRLVESRDLVFDFAG